MRVLVACEYSATVRDAFRKRGHDAWSCDLLPTEGDAAWHIQEPLEHVFGKGTLNTMRPWDLVIAHPPCTHLAVSGARFFAEKKADGRQGEALDFVRMIMAANCERIALENPINIISSQIRKPDQIIQPWQFGHAETKATCLWLKGLPKLVPTGIVEPDYMRKADGSYYRDAKGKRYSRIHFMSGRMKDTERWKERSRTYQGIADAMAEQWG